MQSDQGEEYKWGLCTLFWAHLKLFIKDIHHLERRKLFFLHGYPIQKVHIGGVVVSRQVGSKNCQFSIDDGTGSIDCIKWYTPAESIEGFAPCLGDWYIVQGRLSEFRSNTQIIVDTLGNRVNVALQVDPNAELLHWLDVLRLAPLYKQERILSTEILENQQVFQLT